MPRYWSSDPWPAAWSLGAEVAFLVLGRINRNQEQSWESSRPEERGVGGVKD